MAKKSKGKQVSAKGKSRAKKKKRSSASSVGGRRHIIIALSIIAVATFIAFTPVLSADWVDIDDEKLITNKGPEFLRHSKAVLTQKWTFNSPHWKPVTVFTWYLEYLMVGDKPFLYHLNNLLLHIFNALMVFFLARKLASKFDRLRGSEFYIGFFAGLLFGLHPMHVESVAWAVERKDVLFTFFYFASLLSYTRYLDTKSMPFLLVSALTYAFSIFSKSPGITLILVLFLFDFVWRRKLTAGLIVEKVAHLGVFAFALYALGVFRSSGEGSIASVSNDKILAKASNVKETPRLYGKIMLGSMRGWLWYFHSLFPFKLSLGYPREALISFFGPFIHVFPAMLVAGAGALLYYARKYRLLFFGHAFFFITILLSLLRLGLGIGIFMSDRYVYLPVFGLIILMVSWILTLGSTKKFTTKARMGVLGAIALVYAITSFGASKTWKNTDTLWTNVIEKYPSVAYSYVNRGSYYRELGLMNEALVDLNKGVELDDNANARVQRGLVLRQSGRALEAIADYTRALEFEPNNNQALVNRGNAHLDAGQYRKAIADYDRVIGGGTDLRAGVNRAIAYASLGDYQSAERSFAEVEASAEARNYADFFMNRGILYSEMRQYQKAIDSYSRYLQIKPDDHQIKNDIGVVYAMSGDHNTAIRFYTEAINMYPDPRYLRGRANSYDRVGNSAAAQQDRQRAGQ